MAERNAHSTPWAEFEAMVDELAKRSFELNGHSPFEQGDPWPAPQIAVPRGGCDHWLVTTKRSWIDMLYGSGATPGPDVGLIIHGVPASATQCRLIEAALLAFPGPARFVGDLAPHDLTVYFGLRIGAAAVAIEHLGVNDAWFATVAPAEREVHRITSEMDVFERENLRRLCDAGLDLASVVGPKSAALLESGRKLEVEGASNPNFWGEKRTDSLRAIWR